MYLDSNWLKRYVRMYALCIIWKHFMSMAATYTWFKPINNLGPSYLQECVHFYSRDLRARDKHLRAELNPPLPRQCFQFRLDRLYGPPPTHTHTPTTATKAQECVLVWKPFSRTLRLICLAFMHNSNMCNCTMISYYRRLYLKCL